MADEPEHTDTTDPKDTEGDRDKQTQDKTFTQADIDRVVNDRLKRERDKFGDYAALKEKASRLDDLEQANQSELEKLTGKLTKAEQDRDDAKQSLLRFQVGAEKKLDPELLPFLTGESKDELETKADLLLSKVAEKEPEPAFDGGVREAAPEPKTPQQGLSEFLVHDVLGRPKET